jgi:excisionase family DNA binding protein
MLQMLGKKYYTVTQAAEIAGCTVSYVRRLLRENLIAGEKIGERAWVIPANQLEILKQSPTGKPGRPRSGKKSL